MKKLFVLIFTLTLSTNAFSWGTLRCDSFLDARKGNDTDISSMLTTSNISAFTFFIFGIMEAMPTGREILTPLATGRNLPVSTNQMLYLIEKECRNTPTQFVSLSALFVYRKIVSDALKKK